MSKLFKLLQLWPDKQEAQQACHMLLMRTKSNRNISFEEAAKCYVFSTHTATNTMCEYSILKAYHYANTKGKTHCWTAHYELPLKTIADGIRVRDFDFMRNFGAKKMKLVKEFFTYHGFDLKD